MVVALTVHSRSNGNEIRGDERRLRKKTCSYVAFNYVRTNGGIFFSSAFIIQRPNARASPFSKRTGRNIRGTIVSLNLKLTILEQATSLGS